jgi:hypothetical protein
VGRSALERFCQTRNPRTKLRRALLSRKLGRVVCYCGPNGCSYRPTRHTVSVAAVVRRGHQALNSIHSHVRRFKLPPARTNRPIIAVLPPRSFWRI